MLESRAIAAAILVVTLTLATTLWVLARQSRDAAVMRLWAIGALMAASGVLLNVGQNELPAWLAVTLATPLMLQGAALLVMAMRRLRGLPPQPVLLSLPAVVMAVAAYFWAQVSVNLQPRLALFALLAAVLHLMLVRVLWPLRQTRLRPGVIFVMVPAALMASMLIFRAVATLTLPMQSVVLGGWLHTLTFLVASMTMVAMQTGMLLMQQLMLLGQIQELADHDAPTGLLNRRGLEQSLPGELTGTAVLSLDLDHFKAVNEQNGHAFGDRVLVLVGALLSRHLRAGDLAARMGGEEFAVLLRSADSGTAMDIAERIRADIQSGSAAGIGQTITVSVGVSRARAGETFDGAWRRAEAALAEAKQRGRNTCVSSGLHEAHSARAGA